MRWTTGLNFTHRLFAGIVLVAYIAGCTNMPSGEKAFKDFDSCFAANIGLAAAGGIGIGLLTGALTKQLTGDRSAAKAVGVAAGVAASALIGVKAWSKCSAVYNTSEVIAVKNTSPPTEQDRKAGLNLDRLEVRVEGSANDAPVPEFEFSYFSDDPSAKDIKAKFRHKVEIVRFVAGDHDELVLADAKGAPALDGSGKQIPLEAAMKMPRDRLQWVTIAAEGQNDYVEDVVIQQGHRASYRHKLQIPPRDQLPLPLPVPMRYTLSVEVNNMKSTRTVDFALLDRNDRPKRYKANSISKSADAVQTEAVATRSLKEPAVSTSTESINYTTKRKTAVFTDTDSRRKIKGYLKAGTAVRIDERAQITTNNIETDWVRVSPDSGGVSGWMQFNALVVKK